MPYCKDHGLQQTPGGFCTTGGSLQKAAQAPPRSSARPASLPWGPHRPYEGSQPLRHGSGSTGQGPHRPYEGSQRNARGGQSGQRRGSSSPLRGVATVALAGVHEAEHPVLIAPTRGRNAGLAGRVADVQRVLIAPTRGRNVGASAEQVSCWKSSSPLRGVATSRPVLRRQPGVGRVLIAPTRGRNIARGRHSTGGRMSSSPLRGVATRRRLPCSPWAREVLIAPTRGRNASWTFHVSRSWRPHRPYEGSQHLLATRHRRLLCPHRPYEGSQPADGTPQGRPGVLIAPTRGRNHTGTAGRGWRRPASSSPLRGVATPEVGRYPQVLGQGSSSPLRGVATCS